MIYLDNNATTKTDPKALQAMVETLMSTAGNPSSPHSMGRRAREILQASTRTIASYFQVSESELLFTSGATEALNLLIQG